MIFCYKIPIIRQSLNVYMQLQSRMNVERWKGMSALLSLQNVANTPFDQKLKKDDETLSANPADIDGRE